MVTDLIQILPILTLILGAISLLVFGSTKDNSKLNICIANIAIVFAIVIQFLINLNFNNAIYLFNNAILINKPVLFTHYLILFALLVSSLNLSFSKNINNKNFQEIFALKLFVVVGSMVLVSSREFISWFVALEILSIGSYSLAASMLKSKYSSEAGLKYFIQGALSTCLILFGVALFYGMSASSYWTDIALSLNEHSVSLVLLASGFIIAGLAFKMGLAPFHFWVADVYQGASTAIVVFLSSVVKIAAVVSSLFIFQDIFSVNQNLINKFVWILVVLSIVVGNLVALVQKDFKRLIAYSAVAHSGYLGICFLQVQNSEAVIALINYLVLYTFLTLISFISIDLLKKENTEEILVEDLEGLAKKSKTLALILTINLLALAGLPPIFFGLFGKAYLLLTAISSGFIGLAIIFILGALVGAYYYLKIIYLIYKTDDDLKETSSNNLEIFQSKMQLMIIALLTLSLIYYSFFPQRLLSLIERFW